MFHVVDMCMILVDQAVKDIIVDYFSESQLSIIFGEQPAWSHMYVQETGRAVDLLKSTSAGGAKCRRDINTVHCTL